MGILVELLQRDPYHLDGLISLGETLYESGRPSDAAVAFTRVLRFDPEHVGALYFQGVLLAAQHRFRDAIGVWERIGNIAPGSDFARRARRDMRTAQDLEHIFGRERAGSGVRVPGSESARGSMPFGAAGPVTRPTVDLVANGVGTRNPEPGTRPLGAR
jgi:tetratricopeptide (TPR) repeat protein